MKHILMVDDVTTNLKVAAEVLQPYYQLSMAKSGKQALQFLRKNHPDLILLDIKMPEMDGYETMGEIKLNPKTANIPIIFLTADTEHASEIRGLQMGALDFITKPFEAEVMLGRIEKVLQMEEMRKSLLNTAKKDLLTDLWNRDYVEQAINDYLKSSQESGAAILLDLDGFSTIKSTMGNSVADGVVIRFSEELKRLALRDSLLGRTGLDEFLLFLYTRLSETEIRSLCDEIKEFAMRETNLAKGGEEPMTLSIAVVYFPEGGQDFETLYQNLQKAMYHVKVSGKNAIHFYQTRV